MREKFSDKVEAGRVVTSHLASKRGETFGAFMVMGPCGRELAIIADDGTDPGELGGWEHVSVSTSGKHPPNWQEMCWVKDQFWREDETVLQFHPRKADYINIHPNCLHMWRNVGLDHPLPPLLLV